MACLLVMFFNGRLAMPCMRRDDVRHATLLFCAEGGTVWAIGVGEGSTNMMTRGKKLSALRELMSLKSTVLTHENLYEWLGELHRTVIRYWPQSNLSYVIAGLFLTEQSDDGVKVIVFRDGGKKMKQKIQAAKRFLSMQIAQLKSTLDVVDP